MPRRRQPPTRPVIADPLFGSAQLSRFICYVMKNGKKTIASTIVYDALNQVITTLNQKSGKKVQGSVYTNESLRQLALEKFEQVLEQISPVVEVRSRRVGGATYQVPIEVRPKRRVALAMRWLVHYARARQEKTMILRLAGEILDALEGRGGAMKQKENVYRMSKANQVYSHYHW